LNTKLVRDFAITGMPRSGTTLVAALAHSPPDSVAIAEPAWQRKWEHECQGRPEAFATKLAADFQRIRERLKNEKAICYRESLDGAPLTDLVRWANGHQERSFRAVERSFGALRSDFVLAMKMPALYTATLPTLLATTTLRVVAVVRNPVAAIQSWRAVSFPIANGRLPAGEPYWPELASIAHSERPVLEKQVLIWDLFARRYLQSAASITLLRYEAVCIDPDSVSEIFGVAPRGIDIKPRKSRDDGHAANIRAALRNLSPAAPELYPEELTL
jgi:hypothetical protein